MMRASLSVLLGLFLSALAAPAHADTLDLPPAPPAPSAATVIGDGAQLELPFTPVYGSASSCCGPRGRLDLSLPIWVPGVTGTLATGTQEASTDGGFFDRFVLVKEAITELEFAFVGRVEGSWKRWWGLVDGYGARIGSDVDWTVGNSTTSVKLEVLIARAVVGYEAWRVPAFGRCDSCITFTPYAGVRYFDVDLTVNNAQGSSDWLDGIVGLETRWWISPRWNVRVLADIGTGIDDGSEYCWTAAAEVHFRLARWCSLFAGYSVLGVKYDRNTANRFVVDVTLAGPQLGFTIHF